MIQMMVLVVNNYMIIIIFSFYLFSLYITLGGDAVGLEEGNQESYFDDEITTSDTLLELPAFVLPEGSNIAIQCLSDHEYMEAQLFIENNRAVKIRQYQDANCISSNETVPNRSDGSPQFFTMFHPPKVCVTPRNLYWGSLYPSYPPALNWATVSFLLSFFVGAVHPLLVCNEYYIFG